MHMANVGIYLSTCPLRLRLKSFLLEDLMRKRLAGRLTRATALDTVRKNAQRDPHRRRLRRFYFGRARG